MSAQVARQSLLRVYSCGKLSFDFCLSSFPLCHSVNISVGLPPASQRAEISGRHLKMVTRLTGTFYLVMKELHGKAVASQC